MCPSRTNLDKQTTKQTLVSTLVVPFILTYNYDYVKVNLIIRNNGQHIIYNHVHPYKCHTFNIAIKLYSQYYNVTQDQIIHILLYIWET